MATKRIPHDIDDDIIDVNNIDGSFEDVSDIQKDIDSELDSIFSEFGGADDDEIFTVTAFRILPDKGKMETLFSCFPTELPITDRLRDEYDGGAFKIWIYRNKKIFKRLETYIAKPTPLQKIKYQHYINKLKKELESETGNDTNAMSIMAQTMKEGFDRLASVQPPQQTFNPMDMMSTFMGAMIQMKEFMSTNQPQTDPFDMVEKVLKLKELMGPTEKESGLSDVVLEGLKTFGPTIAKVTQDEHAAKTTQKRLKNPTQPKKGNEVNKMKNHLIFLCRAASQGSDPVTYARMIVDQTNDDELDNLIDFAASENAIQNMSKVHKPVLEFKEWFLELGKAIIDEVEPYDENEENEEINIPEEKEVNQPVIVNTVQNEEKKDLTSEKTRAKNINNATVISKSDNTNNSDRTKGNITRTKINEKDHGKSKT